MTNGQTIFPAGFSTDLSALSTKRQLVRNQVAGPVPNGASASIQYPGIEGIRFT
ncbi:hypothetical protein M413DRAFT_447310 [Hebeloma cylindrosporum]|uniref:Uncharacterized protein n=1 Tax=Hebeloma cylindrosporum TaxID=76867 RepID=A0A0C2YEC9_HEBCY|nr:hypothetical protein M413DRAFT_447310 [Hebeloma cylindrosporum h7]